MTTSCGVQASSSSFSDVVNKDSEINFTNSTEASYMEKLMLRKKRQDPAFLKAKPSYMNKSLKSQISNENVTLEDKDEYINPSPSKYNLFYGSEDIVYTISDSNNDDSTHVQSSNMFNDFVAGCSHPHSTVEIQEIGLLDSAHEEFDVPVPVTVKTRGQTVKSKPVKLSNGGDVAVDNKSKKVVKRKKKNIPSGKKLEKLPVHSSSSIDKSIHHTWEECSKLTPSTRTHKTLTSFFLMHKTEVDGTEDETLSHTPQQHLTSDHTLPISGSVWLPMSSIHAEMVTMEMNEDKPTFVISQSDLPPCSMPLPSSSSHSCDEYHDTDSEDSDDTVIHEDEEEEDKEKEDDLALEELAWELMSVCTSEPRGEDKEEEDDRVWSRMTLEELVHDFEEYQTQIKEQDDLENDM